jgi:hypothetical protein
MFVMTTKGDGRGVRRWDEQAKVNY